MGISFVSEIQQAEGMTATGIPVPDHVVTEIDAGKNPPVVVTVRRKGNGRDYSYRTSIATRNGSFIMSFSAANRTASGLSAGDPVEVTVALDSAPRTIDIPDDLAAALDAANARARFDALSHSKKRAYVEPIDAAKTPETRARRVEKVVADLQG